MEARGARVRLSAPGEPPARAVESAAPLSGVVDLTPLETSIDEPMDAAGVQAAALRACATSLELAKAVAAAPGAPPDLVFVTRGSQSAGPRGVTQPQQATAWGLRTVAALEHPAMRSRAVDLDPDAPDGEVEALADELLSADAEDELAHRGGARYAARLVRFRPAQATAGSTEAVELHVRERGLLESLALRPQERHAPGPGEVEVRVRAAGLNFRDVLNALGMYPGDPGPLGGECVGVVRAGRPRRHVGCAGDDVMALGAGASASMSSCRPDHGGEEAGRAPFEEAASIPLTFLTAC